MALRGPMHWSSTAPHFTSCVVHLHRLCRSTWAVGCSFNYVSAPPTFSASAFSQFVLAVSQLRCDLASLVPQSFASSRYSCSAPCAFCNLASRRLTTRAEFGAVRASPYIGARSRALLYALRRLLSPPQPRRLSVRRCPPSLRLLARQRSLVHAATAARRSPVPGPRALRRASRGCAASLPARSIRAPRCLLCARPLLDLRILACTLPSCAIRALLALPFRLLPYRLG